MYTPMAGGPGIYGIQTVPDLRRNSGRGQEKHRHDCNCDGVCADAGLGWLYYPMHDNVNQQIIEGTETLTSSAPRTLPAKSATLEDIRTVAEALAKALEDDKAEDLLFIDLDGKSSLADFMIIASGRSGRHVAALADHLSHQVKKLTGRPANVEGMPNADWVLIDTGDVIVHLFRPEVREFYNLEKIWASDTSAHRATQH